MKAIIITFGIIAFLTILGAVGYILTRSTETYKAKEQNYYTFEPHFGFLGGCAHYRTPEIQKTIHPGNRTK